MKVPNVEDLDAIFFLLSYKCNLKCKFCIVDSPMMASLTSGLLKEETAVGYAECLRKSKGSPSEKSIFFYGGEPTLYWSKICKLVERFIQIDPYFEQVNYILFTNGLVPIRDISSFPLPRQLQVRISWSSVTNSSHVLELGKRFRELGSSVFFNVTIDNEDIDGFKKIIAQLHQLSFPMLLNYLRGEAGRIRLSSQDKSTFYINLVRELYAFCLDNNIKEARIEELKRAIDYQQIVDKDCYLNGGRQIIVLPNGSFSICFDDLASNEQNFESREIIDLGNITSEYYQSLYTECQFCEWYKFCSGGCARQNKDEISNKWKRDRVICEITKYLCERVAM